MFLHYNHRAPRQAQTHLPVMNFTPQLARSPNSVCFLTGAPTLFAAQTSISGSDS